eukprot:COSAG05_NODE_2669_length_2780_cov_1.727815_1_plen_121_part_00
MSMIFSLSLSLSLSLYTHTHTHAHARTRTRTRTHSLTHSRTHALTHSLTHARTKHVRDDLHVPLWLHEATHHTEDTIELPPPAGFCAVVAVFNSWTLSLVPYCRSVCCRLVQEHTRFRIS